MLKGLTISPQVSWLALILVLAIPVAVLAEEPAAVESVEAEGGDQAAAEVQQHDPLFGLDNKNMTGDWGGVRPALKDNGFDLSLSYQQQLMEKFSGGLDNDNVGTLSGSYDLVFKLDFEKLGLIDDAGAYLKAKGNWGDGLQGDVGSLKKINSDFKTEDLVYISKYWLWKRFLDDKIELRLGVLETNKDLFDISLYANHEDKDFLNQTSIRNSTVPHLTAMGAFLKIEPCDNGYVQAAALDAQSTTRNKDYDTAFHGSAWYIGMVEAGWTPEWETERGAMPGRYRVGVWYDPRVTEIYDGVPNSTKAPKEAGNKTGFYLGLDQMVWKENADNNDDDQGLGGFFRFGATDGSLAKIDTYWQLGASYLGLIPTRDKDVTGFAASQSMLSSEYRRDGHYSAGQETVYELYYRMNVTPWLAVTPDFQYITNPGAQDKSADSFIAGLRLRFIF